MLKEKQLQSMGLPKDICLEMETWLSLCHCLIYFIPNQHSDQSLLSPEDVNQNSEETL